MLTKWRTPHWHPIPVFVALGALSAVYFALTSTPWAVTGEFTRFGGHALELVGVDASEWAYFEMIGLDGNPLTRTDGWIVIGMLVGSLAAALVAGDVKWRVPRLKRRLAQALVGGFIAGFGARLALGCNLAAMFTGVPQFSFHAWIFTAATALGTWVGFRVIRQQWWRGRPALSVATGPARAVQDPRTRRRLQGRWGVAVWALVGTIVVGYLATGHTMLAVAAGFGAVFGALIQRGQICFTAAFRDIWMTGRTLLGKALVLGLVAATIGTFLAIEFGQMDPVIKPAGLGTLVGGVLFGIGIVLAGGCETGMMYRAVEGQAHYWLVFLGNVIGATVLAYGWDHWGIFDLLVADSRAVNLIDLWGPYGALLGTLAVLVLWYLAMVRRDRRGRAPSVSPAPSAGLAPSDSLPASEREPHRV